MYLYAEKFLKLQFLYVNKEFSRNWIKRIYTYIFYINKIFEWSHKVNFFAWPWIICKWIKWVILRFLKHFIKYIKKHIIPFKKIKLIFIWLLHIHLLKNYENQIICLDTKQVSSRIFDVYFYINSNWNIQVI